MFKSIIDRLFGRAGEVSHRRSAIWDAASAGGSRLKNWPAPATSPSTWWDNPILLRSRAEAEFKNNPLARRIVDCLVNAAWGASAINPQFADKRIQTAWSRWTDGCDAAARLDWCSLGALVLQTVIVSGEAFVRFVLDEGAPGVPLRLQALGPEFLDVSRQDGDTWAGIRYKGLKPEGYWLFKQSPALMTADLSSVFVPASDCLHIFRPIAPGAQRGQTWLAPVLLVLKELNEYLESSLVKAKIAALFCGYVQTPDGSNPLNAQDGAPSLEPGSMTRLRPGEVVEFSEPPGLENAFDPFVKAQMRRIAAGMGLPYELLSTDISMTTFASGRLTLLELRRTVEMIQYGLLVPQFCAPVLRRWALLARALGATDGDAEVSRWIGPTVPMLDEGAEVRANIQKVRAGFSSRGEIVARDGWRIEDVDAEIRVERDREERDGLVYDTNPAKTTLQGQQQKEPSDASPTA